MKHTLAKISLAAAAMLSFAACDNSDYELDKLIPDEFKRVVSIQNTAKDDLQLFDVGLPLNLDLTILRSGGDPTLEAGASLVTMSQEELSQYNGDYILVDPSYYTAPQKLDFASGERYKKISVVFPADKIVALKEMLNTEGADKQYYVALKLVQEGETTINAEKSYILRRVSVSDPELQFSISGDKTIKGETATFSISVPFNNKDFNIAWDMEFESASFEAANGTESTALGNSLPAKYARKALPLDAIENGDVKVMEPGVSRVDYSIKMPETAAYGTYYFKIKFGNATLNDQPIATNTGDVEATIRFDYCPAVDMSKVSSANTSLNGYATSIAQSGWTFVPESTCDESGVKNAIDGNVGNMWENRWGGSGYGTTSVPFLAALDLGSAQTVNVLEVWRRSGSYVTDLRSFEVYAAKTMDYSNRESIKYSGLTYMGTVDFGGTSNTSRAMLFPMDAVQTQYLLLKFTGSNRGGTCISIAEMCAWTK